ncbi:putative P-loop containing nucleoside triphosphate hydrolase, leucine-rich repeat domain, L [Senna tora]|uniref:Putative P-loop containing nucleoside triphosphate hydrolase, leucine-rich repeat domain, L n=1 Tax=Senna tora TaxID=362788 RepID=A0A835CKT3_9FABA|nr:putative P-loop containing nucleoside triphosphate hydrolase, leucine-rich repeat domain, L [Senna tora]
MINLFSVSICQDLGQLDELIINSCGVEEIVAIEEGSEELRFHFAQLTSLRLRNLTKLKCFYREKHTLNLITLDVSLCEALQIFSFGHLDSQQTIGVGEADLPILQALFHVEKVPSNLTNLSLNENDAMRILNGLCEKNLFTGLETLDLQYFQETPIMFLNDFLEKFPNTTRLLFNEIGTSFNIFYKFKYLARDWLQRVDLSNDILDC